MTNTKSLIEGADTIADLGMLGALVASFFNKTGRGGNQNQWFQRFTAAGGVSATKEQFSKWMGIGLKDEAELWKATLALLGQGEEGIENIIAINDLIKAMKDDLERDLFRQIITTMPAGSSSDQKIDKKGTPEERIESHTKSFVDSLSSLRVKTLEVLAKIVRDESKGGVEVAIDILRNQGLGKDNELVLKARKYWQRFNEEFLAKNEASILAALTNLNQRWMEELDEDIPHQEDSHSMFTILLYKLFLSGSTISFAEAWEIQLIKKLIQWIKKVDAAGEARLNKKKSVPDFEDTIPLPHDHREPHF